MAFEVVMPRLGWSMEVGAVVNWRKRDGEPVEAGEVLFEVEADKAVQEVEALESGILRLPPDSPPLGQQVPVGTLLAYLVRPGESVPVQAKPLPATPILAQARAASVAAPPDKAEIPQRSARKHPAISPRAARMASELGVDWTVLKGSGRTGRIVERDVRQAAALPRARKALPDEVRVSPLARRMAQEAGLDLTDLAVQKPGERIRRADVEAVLAAKQTLKAAPTATAGQVLPITPLRRTIAERMREAAHTTAAVTLTAEADATELVALRERLQATLGPRGEAVPSYTDLFVKLTACALQEHPQLNASWSEEGVILSPEIHIAVAVDTEAGLLAPVLRNIAHKSLQQIAMEARTLAEKARARQLSLDELTGGTFTITNLGMYNIDAFTPIINLPQCAILGVGRIVKKPAEWQDQLVLRHRVALSLTFDHRVVDGGPAARFLDTIREYVEQPYLWLIR